MTKAKFVLNRKNKLKYIEAFIGYKIYNKQNDCYKVKNKFSQITKVVYLKSNKQVDELVSFEYYPSKKVKIKRNILWDKNNSIKFQSEKIFYPNHNVKSLKEIIFNYECSCKKIIATRFKLNGNAITKEIIFKNLDESIKRIISYIYNQQGQLCSSSKAGKAYKLVTIYKQDKLNKIDLTIESIYNFKGELETKSVKEYNFIEKKVAYRYIQSTPQQTYVQG